MHKYNSLRAELRNHMPVTSMENGVGTSELSKQQAGLAMPIMAELNSLMTHLRTNLPKDISDSTTALNEYVGEINTKFSLKIALQPR